MAGHIRAGKARPATAQHCRKKSMKQGNVQPQTNSLDPGPMAECAAGASDRPSLASTIASVVPHTKLRLRAKVLRRLLLPVGPLALVVLAEGAFARYVGSARWSRLSVSLEGAGRFTSNQIFELVRYVEQTDPTVLEQVLAVLSRDATTMAALGVSVAALVLQLRSKRKSLRGLARGGAHKATPAG
jgi:hypothetical protein